MRAEAIYKGATRPAMKLGVPLKPLVALVGSGMLLTMWAGVLVSWGIGLSVAAAVLPALLWMRLITVRDDQRLAQFVLFPYRWAKASRDPPSEALGITEKKRSQGRRVGT